MTKSKRAKQSKQQKTCHFACPWVDADCLFREKGRKEKKRQEKATIHANTQEKDMCRCRRRPYPRPRGRGEGKCCWYIMLHRPSFSRANCKIRRRRDGGEFFDREGREVEEERVGSREGLKEQSPPLTPGQVLLCPPCATRGGSLSCAPGLNEIEFLVSLCHAGFYTSAAGGERE